MTVAQTSAASDRPNVLATIAIVAVYLFAIVAANLLVVAYGPSITIVNAFVFVGLDLVARDRLHDAWRHRGLVWKMGLLIAAGSALSWMVNRDAGMIAVASCVAFAAASVADGLMYHALRAHPWFVRSNGSNVVGALVDSLIFPTVAFGALLPWIVLGQFVAKVAGGLLWSLALTRRESNP